MEQSDSLFILFYGAVFLFIVYWIVNMNRYSPVVMKAENVVMERSSSWPWHLTPYNWWPYWDGWWSGGDDGGYSSNALSSYPDNGKGLKSSGNQRPSVNPKPSGSQRPWGGAGRDANGIRM